MRLEASVPSDQIRDLRLGAAGGVHRPGLRRDFTGKIERISPAADPATRQVPIFVSIPNTSGRLIAGLFAEGRVETGRRRRWSCPATAIDTASGSPTVTRVKDGKAERVHGHARAARQRTERVEIVAGLAEGDTC